MNSCLFSPIKLCKSPSSPLQRSLFLSKESVLLASSSSMESLALPKLWKPPTALSAAAVDRCLVSVVEAVEEEEESFFELEFTLPDYDDRGGLESDEQKIGRIGDFISGEKPDPRTIRSKPQSPIAILKQSAPKLRVFMFGKPSKRSKPESSSSPSQSNGGSEGSRRKARVNFTVKLRFEDAAKKFGHGGDSLKRSNSNDGGQKEIDGFCKKYLNLLKKPLYVKLSTANSNFSKPRKSFDTASFASPRKSESSGKLPVPPVKTFGKCRSAGALLVGASLPTQLQDDSLTQQNDGIQGAILHCKQSFNSSSKERRVMSRSASDTSNEKSFQRTE